MVYRIILLCVIFEATSQDVQDKALPAIPVPAYTKDVDRLGDLIEEKGKDIDRLGKMIDSSTDHMEDNIEARGKEIDSPASNRLIELKGEDIDRVSDVMDREVESRGHLVETQVTGSKHAVILPNGTNEETSEENPIDRQSERVEKQGQLVEELGDLIQTYTRSVIPKSILYRTTLRRNHSSKSSSEIDGWKRSDIDEYEEKTANSINDGDRKVIVPVGKKKLEKLMMFYYLKKKYPDYVNRLIEAKEEEGDKEHMESDSEIHNALESVKEGGSPSHSLSGNIDEKFILPKLNLKMMSDEERIDDVMSRLMTKQIDSDSSKNSNESANTNADVNGANVIRANNVEGDSDNSADSKRILKATGTPLLKKYFDNIEKTEKASQKVNCKGGVKCMVSELVSLLDHTFLKPNKDQDNLSRDSSGHARGGIDPYATIGHASIQHVDDHHHDHDVDHHLKQQDHVIDDFHHHEDNHPRFENSRLHHLDNHHEESEDNEHHDTNVLDESAELEHMIHSIPDLHAVNFDDNVHNNVPHEFQRIHHEEEMEKQREKEEEKERERHHEMEIKHLKEEERQRHQEEKEHREREHKEEKFHEEIDRLTHHHDRAHGHHGNHELGHNFHELEFIHHIGLHGNHGGHHDLHHFHHSHPHDNHHVADVHDDDHHDDYFHHRHERQKDGEFNDGVAPSTRGKSAPVSGETRAVDVYKPYEYQDETNDIKVNFHHEDHHHGDRKKHNRQHKQLKHVHEHIHHHEDPIVHIDHEEEYDEDPGENIHNTLEMISNQGSHVHVHEHPHEELESDDRLPIPEVVHEGPISTASVFSDHFKGPGIRDQPDVHYEEEMDANHYRRRRNVETDNDITKQKILTRKQDVAWKRGGDPYASIGHYPEYHMDIGELEHEEIDSGHEGQFGGGYGWDPSHHGHHHCGGHSMGGIGFGGHHDGGYDGGQGGGYGGHRGHHCEHIVFHGDHHQRRHFTDQDDGYDDDDEEDDDHEDHGHHIHEPNPEPYHFNDHIHPAIPHLYEQLEHEPWVYHHDGHHHHNHHHDHQDHKHASHHHHPEPEPEHQDGHDQDEHRVVHVNVHHPWLHKRDESGSSVGKIRGTINSVSMAKERKALLNITSPLINLSLVNNSDHDEISKIREKRWHHGYHRHHHNHHFFDDDGDGDGGDGHDVARLSYLTEKYGHDMTHDIDEGTHEVEAVGDEIERQVNHQIEDVTEESYDVEAPDYDSRGHFYPTIHEEDVEGEVERQFPHLTQRQLIAMVQQDRYRQSFDIPARHAHIHYDKDDDDDDDDKK